jgi:ParB-like chromosome segregation protein Spo0J
MGKYVENILQEFNVIMNDVCELDPEDYIFISNQIKILLHQYSPLKSNPVDCVVWVKNNLVEANDYNPNSVAPPEMELLRHSIAEDGYTQPIVTYPHDSKYEVVDGFHRNRVGKECKDIQKKVMGYLPVVSINHSQSDKNNRIASTIRHNRARGKHKIDSMSDIVIELSRRNWSEDKIAKNLGMDPDEVLRLKQINGISDIFKDQDFSKAWVVDGEEFTEVEDEENLD